MADSIQNENVTAVSQTETVPKMTKLERWAYGAGEIYGGGYAALLGVVLTFFLTNLILVGIPNAELYAAIIIVVSKVWDAISDPLMGVISDNTRTKLGRRRPWIIIGGALVPVAFAIMFMPWARHIQSAGLRITYACIGYFLLCTVNTISQVPYASLSAEISGDFKERNKANSVKLIYSILASGAFYLIPAAATEAYTAYINHDSSAFGSINETGFFLIVAILCGVIFGISTMVAGIFSKERIPYDKTKKSKFSFKSYATPLKNKSYRYHLIMYITAFGCYDFISALVLYYVTAVVPNITIFGMKMSSMLGTSLLYFGRVGTCGVPQHNQLKYKLVASHLRRSNGHGLWRSANDALADICRHSRRCRAQNWRQRYGHLQRTYDLYKKDRHSHSSKHSLNSACMRTL